jgi:hypothetical protein
MQGNVKAKRGQNWAFPCADAAGSQCRSGRVPDVMPCVRAATEKIGKIRRDSSIFPFASYGLVVVLLHFSVTETTMQD